MRFDLKKACKHCPFAQTPERITFACRERAEEIEEIAYREGFVCHQHAEHHEGPDGESDGYHFRYDGSSQHCFGALAMYLNAGGANIPWEHATEADPGLEAYWWSRAAPASLRTIFEDEEAFLDANKGTQ